MANTKHLPREIRKGVKRKMRRALKQLKASMTLEERKKFKKLDEKVGLKQFLLNERKGNE